MRKTVLFILLLALFFEVSQAQSLPLDIMGNSSNGGSSSSDEAPDIYATPPGGWYYGNDACTDAMREYANLRFGMCYDSLVFNGRCIGTSFSGWWERMADRCGDQGLWRNIQKRVNGAPASTFQLYAFNEISMEINDMTFEQEEFVDRGCDTDQVIQRPRPPTNFTQNFNSPFLYVNGLQDGMYEISLASDFDGYKAIPEFNQKNGWEVVVDGEEVMVNGKREKHLFYELDLGKVGLNRNGKNFPSKENLISYLQESDFLENLGMDATQKQNSLGYALNVLDQMEPASNYYLTVLSDQAIDQISTLTVQSDGQEIPTERVYYAIYPTRVPVALEGSLQQSKSSVLKSPALFEFGEVIVQPEMEVFWE